MAVGDLRQLPPLVDAEPPELVDVGAELVEEPEADPLDDVVVADVPDAVDAAAALRFMAAAAALALALALAFLAR